MYVTSGVRVSGIRYSLAAPYLDKNNFEYLTCSSSHVKKWNANTGPCVSHFWWLGSFPFIQNPFSPCIHSLSFWIFVFLVLYLLQCNAASPAIPSHKTQFLQQSLSFYSSSCQGHGALCPCYNISCESHVPLNWDVVKERLVYWLISRGVL